jgi:hypothetical protein
MNYNWNYLDHLISGYQEEMTESLRFWRARYLLIPMEGASTTINSVLSSLNSNNEILDEEEVRLAGFHKFIDLFEKSRWINPQELSRKESRKNLQQGRTINITMTTFNATSHVKNELLKNEGGGGGGVKRQESVLSSAFVIAKERLTKSSSLESIAQVMQAPSGVSIKDRRWHFRMYERVFIGNECVDWFVREFSDIETRDEAVNFGSELLRQGFFEHVNSKHGFLDGHYFYRMKKEYMNQHDLSKDKSLNLGWFKSRSPLEDPNHDQSSGTDFVRSSPRKDNFKVELSRKLVIQMDPQHLSPRKEIAILHYDTTHNAKNCFHFQIHWLMCTARLIENMLQSWSRTAEKCGLKLVEAPVKQAIPFADDNPFQSVIPILFSVPPGTLSIETKKFSIPSEWFERELLKKFNFVLDIEADELFQPEATVFSYSRTPFPNTQYVHRTGAAIVQILPQTKGFLWVNNRLHLTSLHPAALGRATASTLAGTLRQEFLEFCSDKEKLQAFWNEVAHSLISVNSVSELPEDLTSNALALLAISEES